MFQVYVEVEDDNDNLPLAEAASYGGRVRENCPRHTAVLRVVAGDADRGPGVGVGVAGVTFEITGGNGAGHFAIDETGQYNM